MKKTSLFLLSLLLSVYTFAQDRAWKKEVSRIIDVREEGLKDQRRSIGNRIFKLLAKGVHAGRLNAYSNFPGTYLTKLSAAEISSMYAYDDTNEVIDPVTGEHALVVNHRKPFENADVYKYKLLEDWTFNPATGTIDVEIKYIGPMLLIYGDDGVYRGKQTIFWITYGDFVNLLEENNAKHLETAFGSDLWQSYFGNGGAHNNSKRSYNAKTGTWQGIAMAAIEFYKKRDTTTHFLTDEHEDTSLGQLIDNKICKSEIGAWQNDSYDFSKQFTKADLITLATVVRDTNTVVDPVTGNEYIVTADRDPIMHAFCYNVLENWSFYRSTGKTEIKIKGVAPSDAHGSANGTMANPLLWIKYSDLQPILSRIEQYHPGNTFAMHIWNSFFLSDIKPVLVK